MPEEVFFRTMLFKFFNKIETWEAIERGIGPVEYSSVDLDQISTLLEGRRSKGIPIYSAAYIMPSPKFGFARKHDNHLALLAKMMDDRLPNRIRQKRSLRDVYLSLLDYSGLGSFLAFQFAVDLNYSTLIDFAEESFVVAGPGAIDGISKCIERTDSQTPEDIIYDLFENQRCYFTDNSIEFQNLFGRPLMPIDCQNLLCEISKYARVAHPDRKGLSGRTRIKQMYNPTGRHLDVPFFPPKWGINENVREHMAKLAESGNISQLCQHGSLQLLTTP